MINKYSLLLLQNKNQRTAATLGNGDIWNYTYDGLFTPQSCLPALTELGTSGGNLPPEAAGTLWRPQLSGASVRRALPAVLTPPSVEFFRSNMTGANKADADSNPLKSINYGFDLIGNRVTSQEDGENKSYSSNIINQYTGITTAGAASENPTYDPDGNMLSYGGWNYSWNGENRLVVAENPTTNEKMEFAYDYMGRRLFKKVYNNNVLTKHIVFAYDDYKLIAEFDVLDNNNQTAKYLWQVAGLDVPLMRNEEYFVADGNKNILALKDASGNTTVSYNYDPFGKVTASNTHANPFRFSSEYSDPEFGLVYYNYRYYSPTLGRWLNPDPIEEQGGYNLYAMVNNSSINLFDFIGYGGTSDNLVNIAAKNKMLEDINNGNDSSDAVQKYLDGGYHYIVRNQNNTIFDIVLIP